MTEKNIVERLDFEISEVGNQYGGAAGDLMAEAATTIKELAGALSASQQFVMAWIPEYRDRNDAEGSAQFGRVMNQIERTDALLSRLNLEGGE